MPADSIREQIAQGIISNLNAINTVDFEVPADPDSGWAVRLDLGIDEIPDPSCFVDLSGESIEESGGGVHSCVLSMSASIGIGMREGIVLDQELDYWVAAVEQALMADPTVGDLAIDTFLQGHSRGAVDEGMSLAIAIINFEVLYRHDREDSAVPA